MLTFYVMWLITLIIISGGLRLIHGPFDIKDGFRLMPVYTVVFWSAFATGLVIASGALSLVWLIRS